MDIADCFALILDRWKLDIGLGELLVITQEDDVIGDDAGWYGTSSGIAKLEGQFLYALIRYFKPEHVLEIGCAAGISATHMLAALEKNGKGDLISYDIDAGAGGFIPSHLRHRWKLRVGDINAIEALPSCDFVFEDADHSLHTTRQGLRLALSAGAKVILSHDYFLRHSVRDAWDSMPIFPHVSLLFDNTNTGIGAYYYE